jgi:hypothetical protein
MYAGQVVQVAGIFTKTPADQIDNFAIQFNRVDRDTAVIQRLQHIAASTGAQYQHARFLLQMIRQCRGELIEIGQRRENAIELRQRRRSVTIDVYTQLRRRFTRRVEAHPRCITQRNAVVFDHRDLPQRTAAFLDHPRSKDVQGLAQILVGGELHLHARKHSSQQTQRDK